MNLPHTNQSLIHLANINLKTSAKRLQKALADHSAWIDNWKYFLICDITPPEKFLAPDSYLNFDLGTWFFGEAQTILKNNPLFKRIGELYVQLHKLIHNIWYEKQKNGKVKTSDYDAFIQTNEQLDQTVNKLGLLIFENIDLVRNMIEDIDYAIMLTDLDGHILYVNQAFCQITGYDFDEVFGKNPRLLSANLQDSAFYRNFWLDIRVKGSWSGELFNRRKNGEIYAQLMTVKSIRDHNELASHYVAIFTDISYFKESNQYLTQVNQAIFEINRIKTDLMANISHELCTPMNGIIGMSGLLQDTTLNSEQKEYVEAIRASGNILLNIINDILDFSHIESGKVELEQTNFNIRQITQEVLDSYRSQASKKHVKLLVAIAHELPHFINGDSEKLRQILSNLISNAIKFTYRGEIMVQISLFEEHKDYYNILFKVKDTGVGIETKKLDLLFKPFYQVDSSISRQYGGLGLGLSIVKYFCDLMHGTIGVDSQVGVGSCFWFMLPFQRVNEEIEYKTISSQSHLHGLKIAIIDDNTTNRIILQHQLSNFGILSATANSAEEGIKLLTRASERQDAFEIAIVDIQMPGMNGIELVKTIREVEALKHIKIIMLSSVGQMNRLPEFENEQLQVEAYLNKPVRQIRLIECINSILEKEKLSSIEKDHQLKKSFVANAPTLGKVLVVEENYTTQRFLYSNLEELGYVAGICSQGLEAIACLNEIFYDLVLLSTKLSGIDSINICKTIYENSTQSQSPKFILMVHTDELEEIKPLIGQYNICDIIERPVSVEELSICLLKNNSIKSEFDTLMTSSNNSLSESLESFDYGESPFNIKQIQEFFGDDHEMIMEILQVFLSTTENLIIGISSSIEHKDVNTLTKLTQQLKNSSINLGALKISNIAQEIEESVILEGWEYSQVKIPHLKQAYDEACLFVVQLNLNKK